MEGVVVRARRGQRHAYRPIESSLCAGSEPTTVVKALFELYPFGKLYIADLDAIQGRPPHLRELEKLRSLLPSNVEIWVDAACADKAGCASWLELGLRCVIGSESQTDAEQADRLVAALGTKNAVLSLDFAGPELRGPHELLDRPQRWPERVIAMTLAKVGSEAGPDLPLLRQMIARAPNRKIYAAGGVRDRADLQQLARLGAAGVLLASALHDRMLTAADLAAI
jgi:phosphoribosylformimino-5-aminoimidazole carboxamide ribotide isomerase